MQPLTMGEMVAGVMDSIGEIRGDIADLEFELTVCSESERAELERDLFRLRQRKDQLGRLIAGLV